MAPGCLLMKLVFQKISSFSVKVRVFGVTFNNVMVVWVEARQTLPFADVSDFIYLLQF